MSWNMWEYVDFGMVQQSFRKNNSKSRVCRKYKKDIFKIISVLPQEQKNPGFMSGYGGIEFWLLCNNEQQEWSVL